MVTLSDLGPFNISGVSVSGISSGGYMAVQMHVSHSSIIKGAAIFAAGPFYCAEGSIEFAESKCMRALQGGPNTIELVDLTISDAALGYIDDVGYLKDDYVYLFSGTEDTEVNPAVVDALQEYYSYFIADADDQITTDFNVAAEHCMPTVDYGIPCDELESPYIGKCDFDGAKAAFQALGLIKNTNTKAEEYKEGGGGIPKVYYNESNLFTFDQAPYVPTLWTTKTSSVGATGYIYIPTRCQQQQEQCELHVSYHGCHMTYAEIGDDYAAHAGYNPWAEANNIIVLYPFAARSAEVPLNPNGCWDWWGYTGPLYGVKEGVQVQFVRNMIDDISTTSFTTSKNMKM